MKRLVFLLIVLLSLTSIVSCGREMGVAPETDVPETDVPTIGSEEKVCPEDFRFVLTWGIYGISFYDSGAGELIKTTDATNPDDYVTELHLTDEEKQLVWDAVSELDLDSYPNAPENYDPYPGVQSEPSQTVVLTLMYNGEIKTIQAANIAYSGETETEEAAAFIKVRDVIVSIIEGSEEWKALPDYEFYYD